MERKNIKREQPGELKIHEIPMFSLFLDTTPGAILVVDSKDKKFDILSNREDVLVVNFLSKKEKEFYDELRALLDRIQLSTHQHFFITDMRLNSFFTKKLLIGLQGNSNIILTWDPYKKELLNQTEFWGYLDIFKNLNIFNQEDIAVPFITEFAEKYFKVVAPSKREAIIKLKEFSKYVID